MVKPTAKVLVPEYLDVLRTIMVPTFLVLGGACGISSMKKAGTNPLLPLI